MTKLVRYTRADGSKGIGIMRESPTTTQVAPNPGGELLGMQKSHAYALGGLVLGAFVGYAVAKAGIGASTAGATENNQSGRRYNVYESGAGYSSYLGTPAGFGVPQYSVLDNVPQRVMQSS